MKDKVQWSLKEGFQNFLYIFIFFLMGKLWSLGVNVREAQGHATEAIAATPPLAFYMGEGSVRYRNKTRSLQSI